MADNSMPVAKPFENGFKMVDFITDTPPRTIKGWAQLLWGLDIWMSGVPILKIWLLINLAILSAMLIW